MVKINFRSSSTSTFSYLSQLSFLLSLLILSSTPSALSSSSTNHSTSSSSLYNNHNSPSSYGYNPFLLENRPPNCPPCPEPDCFNCQLPSYNCGQFGECSEYDGLCSCPSGYGGQDCLSPLCGSPLDGTKRFPRENDDDQCCSPGWKGQTCNVCQSDNSCSDMLIGGDRLGENGTCYTGGLPVKKSYQQCDVTNKKITDMLPGRPPTVSFDCDAEDSTCAFQFYIGPKESFYCALEECGSTLERTETINSTRTECKKVKCSCIPGRMLCGESGSIDISDFLTEEIHGPGFLSCKNGNHGSRSCRFSEPGMNSLISDVFGDEAIYLNCSSGECLHYSQVPGYESPLPPKGSIFWVAFSAAFAILFVLISSLGIYLLGRHSKHDGLGNVRLPEEEAARLMKDHTPASIHFEGLKYSVGGKIVLDGINGCVKPGEVMAIAGVSGAGKTTFLDLLARRNKRGIISGRILINGRTIDDASFHRVVGFVDQEDTLLPTLTVYETILYSALLRLPRDMSFEAKKFRTLETMQELGILGIKDSRIGSSSRRSISGGERRRVSIACELVTSPSVLFCDEPTSGLDAYNAYNVIESLVTLAKDYKRTVVFTIHQPRSNIVALFDRIVLLAKGQTVYSGPMDKAVQYFEDIGHPCPTGYNLADHLIDLTAEAGASGSSQDTPTEVITEPYRDEEAGPGSSTANNTTGEATPGSEETELRTRPNSLVDGNGSVKLRTKTSRLAQNLRYAFSKGSHRSLMGVVTPPKLGVLLESYKTSSIAAGIKEEIDSFGNGNGSGSNSANGHPSIISGFETGTLGSYKKASLWTQFTILSGRAFKNLYRNPMLLLAHYAMSVVTALFCALLYHDLTLDIAGFQNRLGLFFFVLTLFGLSTLTSLGVFANERALFVRERANSYYSPLTYFTSKLLFDILPLRVIPPFILGGIVYFLVGLVPGVAEFWKFILTLVLFSLAASSAVFFISIAIRDTGVANLVGSLTMLFSLLFAGLLINRERIPSYLRWLQHLSFYHAAYEGLIINELRTLSLKETKYGISIDVPAASIISSFGFNSQAFWWPDIVTLVIHFVVFTLGSYIWLTLFVKERK